MNTDVTGLITDIKRFAIHDGDGIRTTVFLKGCPLKCVWCHNPESISSEPQLAYYKNKCICCGMCVSACPAGAHTISEQRHVFNRAKCIACGKCEEHCLSSAIKLIGRRVSVQEVMDVVLEDRLYYEHSGGGITISGGEPAMQPHFTLALLTAAKNAGISTALDTCGFAPARTYMKIMPVCDTFLYDIKHIVAQHHIKHTGRDNRLILENLQLLSDNGAKIEIRIPVIPGYNDSEETFRLMAMALSDINIAKIKLLPYHALAGYKYNALDMEDTLPAVDSPNSGELSHLEKILIGFGFNTVTG